MKEFYVMRLSKADLQKALESFDGKDCTLAVEMDSTKGDQILWTDNGKYGDARKVVIINKPWVSDKKATVTA